MSEQKKTGKPTEAEIEEFWKRYGFKDVGSRDKFRRLKGIEYPDGCIYSKYPPIDLNHLFKYAVDEALNQIQNDEPALYPDDALQRLFDLWMQLMEWYDTEIALFWAIEEVMPIKNPNK